MEAPRGVGCGEGVSPSAPPQKIFDYLILKWRILMHISGILTYLF